MPKERAVFDLDNAGVRETLCKMIKSLRGSHWLEITKCREQRTLAQNAFYWGVVLPRVADGITEAWGEDMSSDAAHEFLKDRFLKKPIVNRNTGELMGQTEPSTASLNTEQFGKYLDDIIKFSAEQLDVEIPIALRAAEVAS